jgi:hypothetical protein
MLPNDAAALMPYLYADGLRNPFDFAFNDQGELFAGDNGPDIDLPDEINWIREGQQYGFPWRFGNVDNPVMDPMYTATGDLRLHTGFQAVDNHTYVADPGLGAKPANLVDPIKNNGPDWNHYRSTRTTATPEVGPLVGITGHRSPLGINFDAKAALCGDYYKSGFVLSYGALIDELGDGGQDLGLIQLTKVNGDYEMKMTQIVTGFTAPIDAVLVGNKLYVVEFGGVGSAYEITFPTP